MGHLWVKDASGQPAVMPLGDEAISLATHPPEPLRGRCEADRHPSCVVLLPARGIDPSTRALMAGPESNVRVNGIPMAAGLRVVADRDEIRVAGVGTFYFSTESLARIEPHPGAAQRLFCPRCKQEIAKGVEAVKCPQCGVWHHQADDLPCWTYSESCALCPQPTDLAAGFRWVPEDF